MAGQRRQERDQGVETLARWPRRKQFAGQGSPEQRVRPHSEPGGVLCFPKRQRRRVRRVQKGINQPSLLHHKSSGGQ
jgi:hypothetical protein